VSKLVLFNLDLFNMCSNLFDIITYIFARLIRITTLIDAAQNKSVSV